MRTAYSALLSLPVADVEIITLNCPQTVEFTNLFFFFFLVFYFFLFVCFVIFCFVLVELKTLTVRTSARTAQQSNGQSFLSDRFAAAAVVLLLLMIRLLLLPLLPKTKKKKKLKEKKNNQKIKQKK